MMIGRQDGENLFLLNSDRLTHWEEGELLLEPQYPWELVQIGNCGPPIELDEGWLLLTHGVGAMRKYSIGAVLLDKDDPSKVLGRTRAADPRRGRPGPRGLCPQRRLYLRRDPPRRQAVPALWRGRQLGRVRVRADQGYSSRR